MVGESLLIASETRSLLSGKQTEMVAGRSIWEISDNSSMVSPEFPETGDH